MAIRKNERNIINAFIGAQEKLTGIEWKIIEWPDANPHAVNEIDAIASRSSTPVAIEHMSIDAIENQRTDSSYFSRALNSLEKELQGHFPFSLKIVIPYEAITKNQNWNAIKEKLKDWILNEGVKLPYTNKRFYPTGLLFSVYIYKDCAHPGNITILRSLSEKNLSATNKTTACLLNHFEKLHKYKEKKYETILLLESSDIALMNQFVAKLIVTAAVDQEALHGVDQIWYADTSGNAEIYFSTITPHSKREIELPVYKSD